MVHENLVFCVLLGKRISELLRESSYKQRYVDFFAENNKHYDFDNLSMYDVYEISVIANNKCHYLLDNNYDCADEISIFLDCCHVFIEEMENNKNDI